MPKLYIPSAELLTSLTPGFLNLTLLAFSKFKSPGETFCLFTHATLHGHDATGLKGDVRIGLRVEGLGLKVLGVDYGSRIRGLGFELEGPGFRVAGPIKLLRQTQRKTSPELQNPWPCQCFIYFVMPAIPTFSPPSATANDKIRPLQIVVFCQLEPRLL